MEKQIVVVDYHPESSRIKSIVQEFNKNCIIVGFDKIEQYFNSNNTEVSIVIFGSGVLFYSNIQFLHLISHKYKNINIAVVVENNSPQHDFLYGFLENGKIIALINRDTNNCKIKFLKLFSLLV